MTAESLEHLFIFIGIMATWLFPLWLYFHWLEDDDTRLTGFVVVMFAVVMVVTVIYFTLIAHYFEFTVRVSI